MVKVIEIDANKFIPHCMTMPQAAGKNLMIRYPLTGHTKELVFRISIPDFGASGLGAFLWSFDLWVLVLTGRKWFMWSEFGLEGGSFKCVLPCQNPRKTIQSPPRSGTFNKGQGVDNASKSNGKPFYTEEKAIQNIATSSFFKKSTWLELNSFEKLFRLFWML